MAITSTADHADELVEQIDSGEVDPSKVDLTPFVEEDGVVLTPELAERLPDERVEEYNQRVAERDQAALKDAKRERAEELDQLASVVDDDAPTEPVELGEATVMVRTKLTGDLEDNLDEISKLQDRREPGVIGDGRDLLIDTILMLIEGDDESGEYTMQDRTTWEAFYREHGTEGLAAAFERLVEPALERRESLKNSHGGTRGR